MSKNHTADDSSFCSGRIHASGWYQITPRSFRNIEILFDSSRIFFIFAGESYKSFLLRQDGRNERAKKIGKEHYCLPPQELSSNDQNEVVDVDSVQQIRLSSGSLLKKPKLVLESNAHERTFYHSSRRHGVQALAQKLAEKYSIQVSVDEKTFTTTDL